MFEQIEKLKRQFTDKFCLVDVRRPELARFAGMTGLIKTVNMSGRALVQFDEYNNIAWYDIDLSCLTVTDEPPPKPVEDKEAKKAAPAPAKPAAEVAKPAAKAVAKPAAAPTAGKSTADILAAARGKAADAPAAAEKPAPARTTADILAAARAKSAAEKPVEKPAPKPAAAKPVPAPAPVVEAVVEEAVVEEPAVEEPVAEEPVVEAPAGKSGGRGDLPKETSAIIAWCRKTDSK